MPDGSSVTAWVPLSTHDKLLALATRHNLSVSAVMRKIVTVQLRDPDAD